MDARLLILGILHRGDFHPYEVKRRLEAAMVECYIDVDVGTLYYAVRQLQKNGLIDAVAEERVARGGVRTIYRITDEGGVEFRRGLTRNSKKKGQSPTRFTGRCSSCTSPIRLLWKAPCADESNGSMS